MVIDKFAGFGREFRNFRGRCIVVNKATYSLVVRGRRLPFHTAGSMSVMLVIRSVATRFNERF